MATASSPRTAPRDPAHEHVFSKLGAGRQIRLFRMLPEETLRPGRLRASIVHVDLDDLPSQYCALSHCWGVEQRTERLWVDEHAFLRVTPAVAHILDHVLPEGWLWLDAVCVNLEDDCEKAGQVRLMFEIYRRAEFVTAWLGGLEDGVDMALKLSDLRLAGEGKDAGKGKDAGEGKDAGWLAARGGRVDAAVWVALRKMLSRPWFRRLWPIQEMVAAKEIWITCGIESLKWDDLVALISELESFNQLELLSLEDQIYGEHGSLPHGVERIQYIDSLRRDMNVGRRKSIQQLLLDTADAECSDTRDRLFALGGLCLETGIEAFEPDYSLSAERIFIRATKHMLLRDQSLTLLHLAGIGLPRKSKSLPSWLPNYFYERTPYTSLRLPPTLTPYRTLYNSQIRAQNHYPPASSLITAGSLPNSLSIPSLAIDTIAHTSPPLHSPSTLHTTLLTPTSSARKALTTWFTTLHTLFIPPASLSSTTTYRHSHTTTHLTAFLRVLLAGSPPAPHPHRAFDALLALLLHISLAPLDSCSADLLAAALPVIRAVDALPDWPLFGTQTGYLGRGPPRTRAGDRVVLFQGGCLPFVLRKGMGGWRIVGECYVEGLMHDEAGCVRRRWKRIVII